MYSGNFLTGPFPNFCNMTVINRYYIFSNGFSGEIPECPNGYPIMNNGKFQANDNFLTGESCRCRRILT